MDEWLLNLIQCPQCGYELSVGDGTLTCDSGHVYPIVRDIPVFTAGGKDDIDPGLDDEVATPAQEEPQRIPAVERSVARYSSPPALDVGCGTGRNLGLFQGRAVGCDVDLNSLITAANRAETLDVTAAFVCCDGTSLPFKTDSFPFVLSSEVVEHIDPPDRETFADELTRVATGDGKILLSAPLRSPLGDRLATLAGRVGLVDPRSSNRDDSHPRTTVGELSALGFQPHGCLDAPGWSALKARGLDAIGTMFDSLAWYLPAISTHAVALRDGEPGDGLVSHGTESLCKPATDEQ